jgi:hypothetical protein
MSLLNTANHMEENLLEKVAVSQLVNNPSLLFFTISESLVIGPSILVYILIENQKMHQMTTLL